MVLNPMIRFAVLPLVSSLLMTGCSQCQSEVSKQQYIASLDKQCAEANEKFKTEREKSGELFRHDPHAAVAEMEKLADNGFKFSEGLAKLKRPSEDASALDALWKEEQRIETESKLIFGILKRLLESLDKLKNGSIESAQAQQEMAAMQKEIQKVTNTVVADSKKMAEPAKKYGFKSCFILETGFSGQVNSLPPPK